MKFSKNSYIKKYFSKKISYDVNHRLTPHIYKICEANHRTNVGGRAETAIELQFLSHLIISDIDAVMKRIFNDNH